ncbi:sensor histidine kinase [Ruegeria profundi]|uniref:sensor histidine kinase n=1 Tax=Ruegeria profundi TaxID=1685378 RepID=UPI001CD3AEA3|nr:extracellular solute-binding protein [Ruegeria profundi]MCA0930679.1 sensor histidine kinase N-terminal domain-containing protein [Ruegeria profundi]
MRGSLAVRIVLSMAAGFAVLLVLISALLWAYARNAADQSYDLLLAGASLSILDSVVPSQDGVSVVVPHSTFDILALAPDDRVIYHVSQGERSLTGEDVFQRSKSEPMVEPRYFDFELHGTEFRGVEQSRRVVLSDGPRWVTVQVGQTSIARSSAAIELFIVAMAGLLSVSLVGFAFVVLATRSALRPLDRIAEDLKSRTADDLSAQTTAAPAEIFGLVNALNGFMERLQRTRAQNERFIADVAHQTRTSLAALQGHLALASDSEDTAQIRRRLERALRTANAASHLTDQLLAHAMVIHRAGSREPQDIDLDPLLRQLLSELLRETSYRAIDLSFEPADAVPAIIAGDPISIREAVKNLLENAVRHGPPDVSITVRLDVNEALVTLEVEDSGPGIPSDQLERAQQRFQSLNADTAGSGLGLAIVTEVANAHDATVDLLSGKLGGLCVRLSFPARKAAKRGGPSKQNEAFAVFPTGKVLVISFLGMGIGTDATAQVELEIWSATDQVAMAPLISAFERRNPDIQISYAEFETVRLHAALLSTEPQDMPDVVISSAMDLQVDLVNRGYARRVEIAPLSIPAWAEWRSELFGFTFEPAAVIYHRPSIAGDNLPRNRLALSSYIAENEERLRGRIATYDIEAAGVGYLFATQQTLQYPDFFRLAETLGRADVVLLASSRAIIDRVANGELLLGVDVLGSYAITAASQVETLGVHFFDDVNPVMTRTVFIPYAARNPQDAEHFVRFLLSDVGQSAIAEQSGLLPIAEELLIRSSKGGNSPLTTTSAQLHPIRLSVGLLTFLDELNRANFLEAWSSAVRQ